MLTHARLLEALHYDPETGTFTWRVNTGKKPTAGRLAGCIKAGPHGAWRSIGLDGCVYRAGRLAWFYMTGRWPSTEVGRIDGDATNDRWSNLREDVMTSYKDLSPEAQAKARAWQKEHQRENTLRHRDRYMAEKKYGEKALAGKDVDHKKPISHGGEAGTGDWDNLRLVSYSKNRGYARGPSNRPKGPV